MPSDKDQSIATTECCLLFEHQWIQEVVTDAQMLIVDAHLYIGEDGSHVGQTGNLCHTVLSVLQRIQTHGNIYQQRLYG